MTKRTKSTVFFFFFQAEDGIRDYKVTGVQTCALPIWPSGERHSSEHLPAGRGELLLRRQPAAGGEQQAVGAARGQHDLCCRAAFRRPGLPGGHDKSLSFCMYLVNMTEPGGTQWRRAPAAAVRHRSAERQPRMRDGP